MLRVSEVLDKYLDKTFLTEEGRFKGTIVHNYTANYALGLWSPPLPSEYLGYGLSFKNWFDKYVGRVILVETRFYDKELGFSGQLDLVHTLKDSEEIIITDYKSSAQVGSPVHRGQLAGYLHLVNKNGINAKRAGDLKLKADGGTASWVPVPLDGHALNAFLSALNAERYFSKERGNHDES